MIIKRTAMANQPKAAAWVSDAWSGQGSHFADTVHEGHYPTPSPILGPDGAALQTEPRPPLGLALRSKK